ncbi:hypothetical protein [Crossiella sp. S99.1]|uniref:hypothetical protein n=1 Tax=Crossiella sp. S99.1 TaxID=2936271 RepID=UPI001FFE98B5|nr:hypothetical protein [Crossiella sp. S99.1]MCK2258296.1 hypothetical protein [Crossiella sp. S99.1]
MDPHLAALQRLALAGWLGVPIGDPRNPEMLLYTSSSFGVEDSVHVRAHDDAIAFRKINGTLTESTEGTVADVVAEALNWSRLVVVR